MTKATPLGWVTVHEASIPNTAFRMSPLPEQRKIPPGGGKKSDDGGDRQGFFRFWPKRLARLFRGRRFAELHHIVVHYIIVLHVAAETGATSMASAFSDLSLADQSYHKYYQVFTSPFGQAMSLPTIRGIQTATDGPETGVGNNPLWYFEFCG
ncbi:MULTISPECIES: hypothetical protein [unclassified Rhizobium]|uniref:hypothetical protein n=1 Tax=unclassified Rhizobium TaxID=2613769 RepID=UPI0015CB9A55|nr:MULTISPECIES: hypothetical protein [unclassified Rhizobium]MDH7805412.1 hypothetical protein [Rhizobium sp. AN67]